MIRKPFAFLFFSCALLLVFFWLQPPHQAQAQCSTQPSSCKTCHETNGEKPVNQNGQWHIQHASYDFCAMCHGGNKEAADKETAHQGLVTKFADMPTNCRQCHGSDLESRCQVYSDALGQALPASGLNTGPATGPLGLKPSGVSQPAPAAAPTQAAAGKTASTTSNAVFMLVILGLLGGGGGYIFWNERRLQNSALSPRVAALLPRLEQMDAENLQRLAESLNSTPSKPTRKDQRK
ncbi:MAG TPA: hypothetical protein PKW33_02760 [Anaerolineaceae bacterium]|nr:hypothetical protein [Anaerolineaceae bacterium]HPN50483.1 hypothetical protein [Anaerolineaceae bacterium]